MRSPWKTFRSVDPGSEYLVLATSIPAKRVSSTLRMFRGASVVRRQLAKAEGLIGFSLLARPFAKQYATLSTWESEAALNAFVRQTPHRELMSSLAPQLGETKFVRWTIPGTRPRPTWAEALERLH